MKTHIKLIAPLIVLLSLSLAGNRYHNSYVPSGSNAITMNYSNGSGGGLDYTDPGNSDASDQTIIKKKRSHSRRRKVKPTNNPK